MSVYMDYQNRVGHKLGSGAPATWQEANLERKERLRRLALETIDLNKDPYFMRNHLGQFECRLCLTLHTNEGSYLSHTQGKKHQTNLSRRLAKEKADAVIAPMPLKFALLCEVEYPEIVRGTRPYHRFMSAFEQRVETPPDGNYQFLLFAAEPYETIAFKIPNMEIDREDPRHHAGWDEEKKVYTMQIFFSRRQPRPLPALPQRPTTFLPVGARW
ncbi:splicing factor 3A subunit 2 [Cyclospora cayetanensis]|uniref:Splicing factor 3A subunit 2 n=1 Tax=Cyclospora cayetanensis TaxID=88456 RepID=A0A6P6RQW9_9EIME|nr:splicing factor 3A subunit 2 [Cyclospora cayetanensis]